MERYVNADKLIDILYDRERTLKGTYGDLGGAAMGCIRLINANATEDVVQKIKWISVDERLPDESACYLVNIINHFGLDFVTFTYYTKNYGWGVPDVTHWMPLPEPPMMKGGAE